jgi:hypothetical protein
MKKSACRGRFFVLALITPANIKMPGFTPGYIAAFTTLKPILPF